MGESPEATPSNWRRQVSGQPQPALAKGSKAEPGQISPTALAGGDPGAQRAREGETPASRATRLKFLLPGGVALMAAEHPARHPAVEVRPDLR